MLMAGMMIPSDGSHGIFTIKSLTFISTVLSLSTYAIINGTMNRNQSGQLTFLFTALIFLFLWVGISLFTGTANFSSIYDQFKLLLLTISVVLLTLYIAEEKLLPYQTFIKTLVYANFSYTCVKLVLIVLYFTGLIDLSSFMTRLGIRYMTMAIYGDVTRLQTSVDIITPFLLYFVLQSKVLHVNFSNAFKFIFYIVSVASIFFSFSRYLMAIAALSFILYWCSLGWMRKMKSLAVMIALAIAAVSWIGIGKINTVIETRFFSRSAWTSDATREAQINALLAEFKENPLFGKGIGSYSEKIIRDKKNNHSYEVQWIAFLMQLGIIGLVFLLTPLVYIGSQFWIRPFSFEKISFFITFICWLIAGFFNPFLISLASGIVYALFAWTAKRLREL
jgi:hypothetical protein